MSRFAPNAYTTLDILTIPINSPPLKQLQESINLIYMHFATVPRSSSTQARTTSVSMLNSTSSWSWFKFKLKLKFINLLLLYLKG